MLPFLQIAGNGGAPDPVPGLCPWTKLRDFRLSDNLTPHHHRGAVPQTVGLGPQGTGACPHFTNSWARRTTWGKQETRHGVLLAMKALAKMTNCTRRAINLNNFPYHGLYASTSCCISHGPCQWDRAIFDPPQLRDPWTDFHET